MGDHALAMTKPSLVRSGSSPLAQRLPGARNSKGLLSTLPCSAKGLNSEYPCENDNTVGSSGAAADVSRVTLDISPQSVVRRRTLTRHGMTAESIDCKEAKGVTFRFHAPLHLLIAYEQAERTNGESFVEGLPPSALRKLAHRLTFVPAGREYRDRHEPGTRSRLTLFYFAPQLLAGAFRSRAEDSQWPPRLLFEDLPLWHAAIKLNGPLKDGPSADLRYFQALGTVLMYELVRSNREHVSAPYSRGGLAGWQQRIVTAYIEEHLEQRISLATLARLVRLSPYHFSRAFSRSLGVPPQRYHRDRRIEYAQRLLAKRELSVTEVGLMVGFRSSASFATAFRKATGLSPTGYSRAL